MDNLKTFLGTVMTQNNTTTNTSASVKPPAGGPNSAKFVAKASSDQDHVGTGFQQKQSVAAIGGGTPMLRNRTESESSMSSDISSVSVGSTDTQRQMKRKDSEPYFWIMWHS